MAEIRHQPIVRDRIHDSRHCTDGDGQSAQLLHLGGVAIGRGRRENPGSAAEEVRPCRRDPAGRRSGKRVAADEPQPVGQVPRGLDHRALGAPDIGDDRPAADALHQLANHVHVLSDGRREHDQVGATGQAEVVPPGVGRLTADRGVDDAGFDRSR